MNPFRPPFGVPSRPGNPNAYWPNTTQSQPTFNLQELACVWLDISEAPDVGECFKNFIIIFGPSIIIIIIIIIL
ncbi:hypothetical protein Hanom_Chr04g00340401 [Helianthus anomalus]